METKKIKIINLGRMDYKESLQIQEDLVAKRQAGEGMDTLLLVEHPPVITLGRRGKYSNILVPEEFLKANNIQVYEVSRGGDVTYHGPGQIVGYPIMDLRNYGRDIKDFVWKIEEIFIRLLDKEFNIKATREENKYTGVWIGNKKITAIGIAVKKWVTMHGFAFNVNTNLDHFNWIVPCGLSDRGVTSLEEILGEQQDLSKLNNLVAEYFCQVFGLEPETERL
ncbi:MAG TPA: lipoyl(octanoyl) transferase LipB [Clostridiaceae bacterium]|nr:lipoyl(octanoyl) transferase LipB [Clostridiaceae bacterium]